MIYKQDFKLRINCKVKANKYNILKMRPIRKYDGNFK